MEPIRDMGKHVRILGILYIVFGFIMLLTAVFLYVAISMGGILSGDQQAIFITQVVGIVIGSFILLVSIPGIIGGFGLLKYKEWARILVLIMGFLNLINVPLGTILGVYTIWVLMNNNTEDLFQQEERQVIPSQ